SGAWPVVAVRVGGRARVRGMVQDGSGSGQALFVEPLAVVELNNRLAEALSVEREEVERILAELSTRVGASKAALDVAVEAAAALDLALACGLVSRRWRGATVRVTDEVQLLGARHPLLPDDAVVP